MTSRVPATPVVLIAIDGDTVLVNGQHIDTHDAADLRVAAVTFVAKHIAEVLARPVRAIATDDTGKVALIVHPDGTSSDAEVLESFDPPVGDGAELAQVVALPIPRPIHGGGHNVGPAIAPVRTAAFGKVALALAAVFLLFLLVSGYAVFTQGDGDDRQVTRALAGAPPTSETSDGAVSTAPAPSLAPTPTVAASPPPRRLEVKVLGGTNAVSLEISTSRLPVRVSVTVDPAGSGKTQRRTVTVRAFTAKVRFKGIAAGRASWRVSVPDAPVAHGQVRSL